MENTLDPKKEIPVKYYSLEDIKENNIKKYNDIIKKYCEENLEFNLNYWWEDFIDKLEHISYKLTALEDNWCNIQIKYDYNENIDPNWDDNELDEYYKKELETIINNIKIYEDETFNELEVINNFGYGKHTIDYLLEILMSKANKEYSEAINYFHSEEYVIESSKDYNLLFAIDLPDYYINYEICIL